VPVTPYFGSFSSHAGFSMLFSADASGMWGRGTYFSTKVKLAKTYRYQVPTSSADVSKPVYQILVADVLTGKAKMLPPDNSIKMPPEIEDASLTR